jgi:hypothetical protein
MSDFLANLVARSVSAAAAVRPHVISIFEPPSTEGGAILREGAPPEARALDQESAALPGAGRLAQLESLWRAPEQPAADVEPEVRPAKRVEPPRVRPAVDEGGARPKAAEAAPERSPISETPRSRASPRRGAQAGMLPAELTHQPAAELPGIIAEATGARPAGANDRRHETAPLQAAAVPPSAPAPATPVRAQRRAKSPPLAPIIRAPIPVEPAEKHSGAQPAAAEADIAGAELHAQDARHGRAVQPQPAPASRIEPAQSVRAIVPAPIAAMPRILPAPAHREGATEATTIHVSIGRVEVRATPPPAAARPRSQPAAAPVMSLDEYLRQRAAGGRR